MLFLLIGTQNSNGQNYRRQNKSEVFFENIYLGDNLEICLAKGTVQYNPDYNAETVVENDISMLELANNHIVDSYFTNSDVKFDGNNIIKEIVLKFQQDKKGTGKTAKQVFNYMTQYFCQRYQGMKTGTINEDKVDKKYKECEVKFRQTGMTNLWETNRIKISLKSYDNYLLDSYNVHKKFNPESFDAMSYIKWLEIDSKNGKWVELKISVK